MYIREFSNAIETDVCREIIQARDSFDDIVYWIGEPENSEWKYIISLVEKKVNECIDEYFDSFKNELSHKDLELLGFGLIRQPKGVFDPPHFDTPFAVHDNRPYIRPFVCLVYLDGENIEGGELIFLAQKKIIVPQTGKVLIFPCSYMFPHQVSYITEGERQFIRLNYCFKDNSMIDQDLNSWNVLTDGIQKYDK
jgi:hypothetical protein